MAAGGSSRGVGSGAGAPPPSPPSPPLDEDRLVEGILCGSPPLSRNRNYELLSSESGRRARRRAAFLRSLAREVERSREDGGSVTLERGSFPRGTLRVVLHRPDHVRRAYLREDEFELICRAFPTAGKILKLPAQAEREG